MFALQVLHATQDQCASDVGSSLELEKVLRLPRCGTVARRLTWASMHCDKMVLDRLTACAVPRSVEKLVP